MLTTESHPNGALGGVLGSILSALFGSGFSWLSVLDFIVSHQAQIKKAVQDVLSGADLQTIINDLLALLRSSQA